MKEDFKNKKGITLIALVITIILMLILVAVTINLAVNGNLFSYAGNAVRETNEAIEYEKTLGDVESGLSTDELIAKYTGQEMPKPAYSESLLNSDGVLIKNAIWTDTNNKTVEIPRGFKVSNEPTEQTMAGGLVIQDKVGNEFVWIPVEYTKTNIDANNNNLDDGFEAVFYRSPWGNNARGTTNYTESTTYLESESKDPTSEYKKMMMSVQEHKGFYIGRYEAGIPTTENPRTTKTANLGTNTMVVKRDCYPYNYVGWGVSMTDYTSDVTKTSGDNTYNLGKSAVYLSRNMYTGSNYGVTSTLCYGVQWDAMLDFIKDDNHNVNNSITWGNYQDNAWTIDRQTAKYYDISSQTWINISDETEKKKTKNSLTKILLTTGASDTFNSKNIYDVAGNIYEWTMEAIVPNRIYRGGGYDCKGGTYPASSRIGSSPDDFHVSYGFRPSLYL